MGSNLYVAASGAMSRLHQLEIVANNLANSDTVGFKADRSVFRAAIEHAFLDDAGQKTPGAPGGVYVRAAETGIDHQPGAIQSTGAPLDVAIDGKGFFAVQTPEGERYTRAGSFALGSDGQLQTRSGYPVLGESGTIELSRGQARIQANGEIVDSRGSSVARLRLVEFADTSELTKQGDGLFRAPDAVAPEDVEAPTLLEGSIERSNVKPVAELAALMILQRAFDASMQAMQSEDGATQSLIEEISR